MRYRTTVNQILKIIEGYTIKLTLRQIYYRLVTDFGIANTKSNYTQTSRHLVKARMNGIIDDNRIEDRTRTFLGGETGFEDVPTFIENMRETVKNGHEQYDINFWDKQPQAVIVWVEKDALSRVIQQAISEYRVIVAPSRGYPSYTFIKEATRHFPRNKKVVVLHFADFDPSGLDMTRDLWNRLNIDCFALNMKVERVALTQDQIQKYGLVSNPAKRADPRSKLYLRRYGEECWELDAIEPHELQKLVKETILQYIDLERWKHMENRLMTERNEVKDEMSKWIRAIEIDGNKD